jgi:enoyl-CoA hydratase/carnithine racemase
MTETQQNGPTFEATDDQPRVAVEQRGGVRRLMFNRPRRRNAWDRQLQRAFAAEVAAAEGDPDVRVLVITGAGEAFCAGADITELAPRADDNSLMLMSDAESLLRVRKPVIAAINGAAMGLGLVQALYCDVRFCVPSAKLSSAFVRRGVIAEFGIAHLLSNIVGHGNACDLLLSGRVIDGVQAHAMGMVNFLCDPVDLIDEAMRYAEDLVDNAAPTSMAMIKHQLRTEPQLSFEAALATSERRQLAHLGSADIIEGFNAFKEKRATRFNPLT